MGGTKEKNGDVKSDWGRIRPKDEVKGCRHGQHEASESRRRSGGEREQKTKREEKKFRGRGHSKPSDPAGPEYRGTERCPLEGKLVKGKESDGEQFGKDPIQSGK